MWYVWILDVRIQVACNSVDSWVPYLAIITYHTHSNPVLTIPHFSEIVCNTLWAMIFLLPLFFLPVNCGMPVAPGNGSIVAVPNTLGGTEIVFRCNTGFVPTGNMTAVCTSDGISPYGWEKNLSQNHGAGYCLGKFSLLGNVWHLSVL